MAVIQDMKKEISGALFWRDVLVELLGTMILVACHTVPHPHDSSAPVDVLAVGLISGLCVFVIIDSLEHLSGGFINPVVPLAFACSKVVSPLKAFVVIIAECLGGVLGSGMVYGLTPHKYRGDIAPLQLHPSVSTAQAICIEIFVSFLLLFVAAAVFDHKTRDIRHPALTIGMTVAVNITIFRKFTGACMNPALVLGTAVVSGVWKDHWVYWVGDSIGAVLGVVLYHYIFHLLTVKFKPAPQQAKQEQLDLLMGTHLADMSKVTRDDFSNGTVVTERHRLTENASQV